MCSSYYHRLLILLFCIVIIAAASSSTASTDDKPRKRHNQTIVIIGGGLGGLSAAATLAGHRDIESLIIPAEFDNTERRNFATSTKEAKSRQIILLEASDRVGGRMHSVFFNNNNNKSDHNNSFLRAELGATFIHDKSGGDFLPPLMELFQRVINNTAVTKNKNPLRLVEYDYSRGTYFDIDGAAFDREEWFGVRDVFSKTMFQKDLPEFRDKILSKRKFCSASSSSSKFVMNSVASSSCDDDALSADQPLSVSLDEIGVFSPLVKSHLRNESSRRLFDLFCFQFIVQEWQAPLQELSTIFFDGELNQTVGQENDVAIVGGRGVSQVAEWMEKEITSSTSTDDDSNNSYSCQVKKRHVVKRVEFSEEAERYTIYVERDDGDAAAGDDNTLLLKDVDAVVVAAPLGVLKYNMIEFGVIEDQQPKQERDVKPPPSSSLLSPNARNAIADAGVSSVLRLAMCWGEAEDDGSVNVATHRFPWGSSFFGGGPIDETEREEIPTMLFTTGDLSSSSFQFEQQHDTDADYNNKNETTADLFFHKFSSLCRGRIPYDSGEHYQSNNNSDDDDDDDDPLPLTEEEEELYEEGGTPETDFSRIFRDRFGVPFPTFQCARYGRGPHLEFVNIWRLSQGAQPCIQVEMEDEDAIATFRSKFSNKKSTQQQTRTRRTRKEESDEQDEAFMLYALHELSIMFSVEQCRDRNKMRFEFWKKEQRRRGENGGGTTKLTEEQQQFASSQLEKFFLRDRQCPNVTLPTYRAVADWKARRFSKGGYFYPRVDGSGCDLPCQLNGVGCDKCISSGSGRESQAAKQKSRSRGLVFAGEHISSNGNYGNMEGALLSGIEAARLVEEDLLR